MQDSHFITQAFISVTLVFVTTLIEQATVDASIKKEYGKIDCREDILCTRIAFRGAFPPLAIRLLH